MEHPAVEDAMTPDLWTCVLQFVERPAALQALATTSRHFGGLVRDRGCWGRALSPLFHFSHACSAKELRMAYDWTVIRQLPEGRWRDATQLIVAGSFALHEAMVRRGLSPAWYPKDIDVWCVNGSQLHELTELLTERLRALGLAVEATPGCGDYYATTEDRFGRSGPCQDTHDAITKLEQGSCVVMQVVNLRYSFDGVDLGTLSLIGTRPADTRRSRHHAPPLLTAAKVMERFDIDVCRVGLLLPEGDLVFADAHAFGRALKTMTAMQTRKVDASEQEVLKEAKRRRKYESRGFKF
jgi:hypothetical protein